MKRVYLVLIIFLLGVVGLLVIGVRPKKTLEDSQPQIEVQKASGPVSQKGSSEQVELTTEINVADPTLGTGRVSVRQLSNKGIPGKILAASAPFQVYRPQGNYLELIDLDGDGDKEILATTGVSKDRGELRIFDFQDGQLGWFCRTPDRAACLFPYQYNRPVVVDLDSDPLAEIVVYGPQLLGDDKLNFDRYSVYHIYAFSNGDYFEVTGSRRAELVNAFARYSHLPMVID